VTITAPPHRTEPVTSGAYWICVGIGACSCAALCIGARHAPGHWTVLAARLLGIVLIADAVVFAIDPLTNGTWTARNSLPLALCDVALVVAAVACWWPSQALLIELTWFWGLAGTLQAVATPDLSVGFPHLEFFEYVVGHLGIVIVAIYLVVGLGYRPRAGSVRRVFTITVGYTAFVGLIDAVTGADYMFLASRPVHWSLLSVLGPWPWYLFSATGIALVLLIVLDAPFRAARSTAD
jgi:hypothetical integral membrane protein (TIGR02206 family)